MKLHHLFEKKADPDALQGYRLVETAAKKIKQDCQFFLKESGQLPMMRGVAPKRNETGNFKTFSKHAVRTDRKPRSSSGDSFFNWSFDTFFKDKFGINRIRSSSMFVTGSESVARYYGDLTFVFPINKFEYIWSPNVNDSYEDNDFLYNWSRDLGLNRDWLSNKALPYFDTLIKDGIYSFDVLEDSPVEEIQEMAEYLIAWFEKDLKYKHNTSLVSALKSGHEIFIPAPQEYYSLSGKYLYEALDCDFYDDVIDVYKKFISLLT